MTFSEAAVADSNSDGARDPAGDPPAAELSGRRRTTVLPPPCDFALAYLAEVLELPYAAGPEAGVWAQASLRTLVAPPMSLP